MFKATAGSRRKQPTSCSAKSRCARCEADRAFLRRQTRLRPSHERGVISVVDLFSGCGGMTIGFEEAARRAGYELKIPLAADCDPAAVAIYKANFPTSGARVGDVRKLFHGTVGAPLTAEENRIADDIGHVDVLCGGPPCQGHSDLNNHTRRKDPKNSLYLRMARAAEVLLPNIVVVENVTAVQWDEGRVVSQTSEALIGCGYDVAAKVLDLRRIGVPQRRKRFVLIASRLLTIDPSKVLARLATSMPNHPDRSLRWAIGDLLSVDSASVFDTPSRISEDNAARINVLFDQRLYDLPNKHRPECHRDGDHSYVSMYGRLRWSRPGQTITTGFGSMGQGRYVHPQRKRTLTPHEAARLQTFPDWFDFGEGTRRGVLATVIGNAVPPFLTMEIGRMVIPALTAATEAPRGQRKRA